MIQYEFPFNERIRTYLRLEHLFFRLGDLMGRNSATDHHFAITTLFEILEVGARSDLRTDVLKDLDKQKSLVAGYRGNPAISEKALEQVLGQLDTCLSALRDQPGKLGQSLTEVDWLMSLRSRANIPGGTCEFDLPAYHAWRHKDAADRRADLKRWIEGLLPLAESVGLLLKLLRDSGVPQKVLCAGGHYQQNLPKGRSFQLMRLRIDPALGLFPEVSGNRLVISVRLMTLVDGQRVQSSSEDAPLEIALCS
ncbi:MAG: cell division protein ZapD [Betaproteobacteria bacterium]